MAPSWVRSSRLEKAEAENHDGPTMEELEGHCSGEAVAPETLRPPVLSGSMWSVFFVPCPSIQHGCRTALGEKNTLEKLPKGPLPMIVGLIDGKIFCLAAWR